MTTPALDRADLWTAIHAERAGLADDLAGLDDAAWSTPSSCDGWTVQDVVAHLTAAASTGRLRWIVSIVGRTVRRRRPQRAPARRAAWLDAGRDARALRGTLALTMAMAGRIAYCDELTGPGADALRERVVAHG